MSNRRKTQGYLPALSGGARRRNMPIGPIQTQNRHTREVPVDPKSIARNRNRAANKVARVARRAGRR